MTRSIVLTLIGFLTIAPVMTVATAIGVQAQTVDTRKVEADRLLDQGTQQHKTSQFEAAFRSWQEALKLYYEIRHRKGQSIALGNIGIIYLSLGKYPKAIEYFEQHL